LTNDSHVLVERDGAAATLTLNRPQARNAFDKALVAELKAVLADVGSDDEVRAVVLTGAGQSFSAGADLKAGFDPTPHGHPDVQTALNQGYHPIIEAIRTMPKPVVAAVNGAAAGIGCSMALACDLVLAAESAFFLLAFVNIGLVADGGSSLLIPERAGFARAAEMALLGERIPAGKALEWGLINRVVADDQLPAAAHELAARLAQGPTRSYAGTKRQLNAWLYGRMREQLELEAAIQQELAATDDFAEGVQAFVAKRPPRFHGR
jgi:2-(1,2-epoxy-1,2-dihydrophenyl)acetyl-CoA isomerase